MRLLRAFRLMRNRSQLRSGQLADVPSGASSARASARLGEKASAKLARRSFPLGVSTAEPSGRLELDTQHLGDLELIRFVESVDTAPLLRVVRGPVPSSAPSLARAI